MTFAYTKNDGGTILVVVVVAFLMITVAGATMVTMIASSSSSHMNVDPSHRAFYLAESGKLLADYLKLPPATDITYTFNVDADESIEISFSGSATGGYFIKSQGRIKAGDSSTPILTSPLYAIRSVNNNYTYEFGGERSAEPFDAVFAFINNNLTENDAGILDDESVNDNDAFSDGTTINQSGDVVGGSIVPSGPHGDSVKLVVFEDESSSHNVGARLIIHDKAPGENANSLDLTTTGALMSWVYLDMDQDENYIASLFSKGEANGNETYSLRYINDRRKILSSDEAYGAELILKIKDSAETWTLRSDATRLETKEWHHIAATWGPFSETDTNGGMRIFIDGILVNSNNENAFAKENDAALYIGSNITSGDKNFHFKGYMDDMIGFDRLMTVDEIQSLYLGRVLHYPFNREALTKVADIDLSVAREFDTIEVELDKGERGNITADESIYRRHGILHPVGYEDDGAPNPSAVDLARTIGDAVAKGKDGKSAYLFAGRDHYISAGSIPFNLAGSFSVTSWFKHEGLSNTGTIVENYGQFELEQVSGGIKFGVRANETHRSDNAAIIEPLDGDYMHLTGVYDTSEVRLYVDGVDSPGNNPYLTGVPESGTSLVIGRRALSSNNLEGAIDGVSVFTRALRSFEISSLIESQVPYHNNTSTDWLRYPVALHAWHLNEINTIKKGPSYTLDSISQADGKVEGEPEIVESDILGNAYQFDGVNQYVFANGESGTVKLDLSSYPFTINLWVNNNIAAVVPASVEALFTLNTDSANTLGIILDSSAQPALMINGVQTSTASSLSEGWHMITAVFTSAASTKLYVDGANLVSGTGTSFGTLEQWSIGQWSDGANPFSGLIDEIYIYNKELVLHEIETIYSNMSP